MPRSETQRAAERKRRNRKALKRREAKACDHSYAFSKLSVADQIIRRQESQRQLNDEQRDALREAFTATDESKNVLEHQRDRQCTPRVNIPRTPHANGRKSSAFTGANTQPLGSRRRASSEQAVCGAVDLSYHSNPPEHVQTKISYDVLRNGSSGSELCNALGEVLPGDDSVIDDMVAYNVGSMSLSPELETWSITKQPVGSPDVQANPEIQVRSGIQVDQGIPSRPEICKSPGIQASPRLIDHESFSPTSQVPAPPEVGLEDQVWQVRKDSWANMLQNGDCESQAAFAMYVEEIKNTPIFSGTVLRESEKMIRIGYEEERLLPQFGLLGLRLPFSQGSGSSLDGASRSDLSHTSTLLDDVTDIQSSELVGLADRNLVFVNDNAPYLGVIYGSTRSGKSHTLSCLLENALCASPAGPTPTPSTGLLFHYGSGLEIHPCEAASLAAHLPVRVLVQGDQVNDMEKAYSGFAESKHNIQVRPLIFGEKSLDTHSLLSLIGETDFLEAPQPYFQVRPHLMHPR